MLRKVLFALALMLLASPVLAAGVGLELGQIPSRGTIPFGKASDGTFVPQKTNDDGTPVISGTVVAATPLPVKPDNVLDGQQVVSPSLTGTGTLFTIATAGFAEASVMCPSVGTSNQITFEEGNDNTNFQAMPAFRPASPNVSQAGAPLSPGANTEYVIPVHAVTFQARVSTYSSGTVTCYATMKRVGHTLNQQQFQITGDGGANAPQGVNVTPVNTAAFAVTPVVSAVGASNVQLCAAACNVMQWGCYSSAAGNCILYNATAAPGSLTDAAVLGCKPVSAGGENTVNEQVWKRMGTGAMILFSSVTGEAGCGGTYTASATAKLTGIAK